MAAMSAVVGGGIYTFYSEQERAHVALQAGMAAGSHEAHQVLRAYMDRANLAANMIIADWRMGWLDPLDQPSRIEHSQELFSLLQKSFPEIGQIAIIRADGFSYPEDHPPNENFAGRIFLGDREYFKAVGEGGKRMHFGSRVVGRLSGLQTLQYAVAARDGQGALQVVVVVSIRTVIIPLAMIAEAEGRITSAVLAWPDGQLVDSNLQGDDGVNVSFLRHIDSFSDQFGGWFISQKSPLDGIERYEYVSYIGGAGLFLALGITQKTIDEHIYALKKAVFERCLWWVQRMILGFPLIFVAMYSLYLNFSEKKLSRDFSNSVSLLMNYYGATQEFVFVNVFNMNILYANKQMSNIFNISTENLWEDSSYLRFQGIVSKDNPKIFDLINSMDVDSRIRDILVNLETTNGIRTIKFHITKFNIEHKNIIGTNEIVGYLGYGRDYTADLADEVELAGLRRDLAALVRIGPGAPYRGYLSDDDIFTIEFPHGLGPLQPIFTRLGADLSDPLGAMKTIAQRGGGAQFVQDLRGHGQARARIPVVDANGQVIWSQDRCVMVEQSAKGLTVAGYYEDVTKLIDTELALEQSAQMARLGAITGGLSHELNQPLAAISMAAENGQMILEDGAAGMAEATEKFSRIAGFAQRAATIVRDMRRFASLEGAEVAPIHLKSVIDSAILIMAAKIGAANLDVTVAVDVAVMPVSATYGLLEQVLVNLIANAVDAHSAVPGSAEKPGWIAIRAEVLANDFVGLSVADNAGGFPPEIATRMFDPFFTTKGPAGGTGLGLSVSFGILKSWGGSMAARNANGGAIFDMTLPVWQPAHPQRISAHF